MTGHGTVVIGLGNPYRRDDGLGPVVVSLLADRKLPGVTLAGCDGEPTRLIELWTGAALAVVVDAVRTARTRPGRVHRLSAYHPAVRGGAATTSSHGIALGEAVDLARVLDRLPDRLLVFAVETDQVGFGVGLSPPVAEAAVQVAGEIADLLRVEVS
jgi:hydrogenase maturation protease